MRRVPAGLGRSGVLDAYLAPSDNAFCVRARFRRRVQESYETPVQFIIALRRLANNCNFGTTAEKMVQDQILHGLRDPDLLRSFVQLGDAFTVQAALEHAREEEYIDCALQQPAALQADSTTRREHQRRGIRPPRPVLLQRYATNPAVPSTPPRSTPLENRYSPAELLMGRRLRYRLSLCSTKLTPQLPDKDSLQNFEERYRKHQRKDFDRRHRVRDLPGLLYEDAV
ncbi:hypothetical protein MRX96_003439 [Rhipicephalus microplus]